MEIIRTVKEYYEAHGLWRTMKKIAMQCGTLFFSPLIWKLGILSYAPSAKELDRQRQEKMDGGPKFSIVIPLYQTPLPFFSALWDSIVNQTYGNWELCLADGSGEDTDTYFFIREKMEQDARVRYKRLAENGGISENTNRALEMAEGDFIVLADHDDLLSPEALYQLAKAVERNPEADSLYSDEDKVDFSGKKYFEPCFKPDYNEDYLRSGNYICHIFAVRARIAREIGGFRKKYDGAQDWDFIFRAVEQSRQVVHIPKILYHWRCHQASTAGNPESKLYAYEAGAAALQDHLERLGEGGKARISEFYGYCRIGYELTAEPLVTVVSTAALSDGFLHSLKGCRIERVCVDEYTPQAVDQALFSGNAESTFPDAAQKASRTADGCGENAAGEMESAFPDAAQKASRTADGEAGNTAGKTGNTAGKTGYAAGKTGYAAGNAESAGSAGRRLREQINGGYVLLADPRMKNLEEGGFAQMLGVMERSDVAVTVPRVYDRKNRIFSMGIILGACACFGYLYRRIERGNNGYLMHINASQDLSAADASCMLVKRSFLEQHGGFAGQVPFVYAAVDFCLRVAQPQEKIVYVADAVGQIDADVKMDRWREKGAQEWFLDRWRPRVEAGDPVYNPNLSLVEADYCPFRLEDLVKRKRKKEEKKGEA